MTEIVTAMESLTYQFPPFRTRALAVSGLIVASSRLETEGSVTNFGSDVGR